MHVFTGCPQKLLDAIAVRYKKMSKGSENTSVMNLNMDQRASSIRALPPDVVAQIKSSTLITNLTGVISELLKNSLDAEARTITIKVDFHKGGCTVEDDGYGIPPKEFQESGGIGKLHRASSIILNVFYVLIRRLQADQAARHIKI